MKFFFYLSYKLSRYFKPTMQLYLQLFSICHFSLMFIVKEPGVVNISVTEAMKTLKRAILSASKDDPKQVIRVDTSTYTYRELKRFIFSI